MKDVNASSATICGAHSTRQEAQSAADTLSEIMRHGDSNIIDIQIRIDIVKVPEWAIVQGIFCIYIPCHKCGQHRHNYEFYLNDEGYACYRLVENNIVCDCCSYLRKYDICTKI